MTRSYKTNWPARFHPTELEVQSLEALGMTELEYTHTAYPAWTTPDGELTIVIRVTEPVAYPCRDGDVITVSGGTRVLLYDTLHNHLYSGDLFAEALAILQEYINSGKWF